MHYPSGTQPQPPPGHTAPGPSSTGPQQNLPSAADTAAAAAAAASTPSSIADQQQKKKRLTQACQHCRKRGRNGTRAPMHASFASPGNPYARPYHAQPSAASAMPMHQAQMLPPSQHQSMFHMSHHGMPPPPPPLSQMAPPQQPHINPLGVRFMEGGPVSLHLKRDPGFGIDPMEESMYDPAKQAYEASSHFMLPVNNFHYSSYAPPPPSNQQPSMRAGPSSSSGSRKPMGIPGTSCFPVRTPSGSSMGYNGDVFPSTSGISCMAGQPSSMRPASFDPTALAQDLSSAYVSVIAGMPATSSNGQFQDAATVAKSATARGKSASHALDWTTSTKMRELRTQISSMIANVWDDNKCGKSAGLAGVSMSVDDESPDDEPRGTPSSLGTLQTKSITSPSGDQLMDEHLLNIFFDCVHHQLPIILRAEFLTAYNRGAVSSLLVSAMCAAASVFLNRLEEERKAIYDRYSQKVRELFHDACFEPNLEVVQTALIMTLCEYRHGSLQRAWVYLSMGFRLAISMGYHHLDAKLRAGPMGSTADISQRESCRRAFWGAFLLDRYTAIGGGKPLGINDSDISVLLPLREKDWQNSAAPPPLSVLEFFKPTSLVLSSKNGNADATFASDGSSGEENGGCGGSPRAGGNGISSVSNGDSLAQSGNTTPVSDGGNGWGSRAGETSALGCFIKLMTVVGQVAQHLNSTKSPGGTGHPVDRPSRDYAALDSALLQWKEELPASLLYSQNKAMGTEPMVFVACMHAIYHGAVIMLNRENMGLLRDLPGQLDVSTNLAIRSLERCRVAAMKIVEIAHHLCTLPSAMTSALLPWALLQAGTLLIHFMICGSSPHAREEARSAILTLDSVLRDELSRYWSVSFKYHLLLSHFVKAWDRTRQSTPSLTPRQPTPAMQLSTFGESATDTYQALNSQVCLPMQMQMHMQLPPGPAPLPSSSQMQMSHSMESFSTLMKPYTAPIPGSLPTPDPHGGMVQQLSISTGNMASGGRNNIPSFLFTTDTAQASSDMLNGFLSQLTHEQTLQLNEGLQTYSLQNSAPPPVQPQMSSLFSVRNTSAGPSEHSIGSSGNGFGAISSDSLMMNAAMHSFGPGFDPLSMSGSVNTSRLQARRGSLPISTNGDLFIAPGSRPVFSTATAPPVYVQQQMVSVDQVMGSDLDPLVFNQMTPFMYELRLLNNMTAQQGQQQGAGMSAAGPNTSSVVHEANGHLRK
ncbi:hypothetical protein H4S03_000453 [Coemansia sp. S3946]|nr:hypothetical protein H4S03_000453 [Coemansia sp. S3946]